MSAALTGLSHALGDGAPGAGAESAVERLRRQMRRLTDCAREAAFGEKLRAVTVPPVAPTPVPAPMDTDAPRKRSADAVAEALRETVSDAATDADADADVDTDADAAAVTAKVADADTDTGTDSGLTPADGSLEEPPLATAATPEPVGEKASVTAVDAEEASEPVPAAGAADAFDEADMASAIEELLRSEPAPASKPQPVDRAARNTPSEPRAAGAVPSEAATAGTPAAEDDADELADMAAAINVLLAAGSGTPGPATPEAASPERATLESDAHDPGPLAAEAVGDTPVGGAAEAPLPAAEPDGRAVTVVPAAAVPAAGGERPSERSRSLSSLDQALADDIDTLLAGDTDSVGAILDEIFDEEAIVVQDVEDDLTLMPDFCCEDGALTERQADDMPHGHEASPAEPHAEPAAGREEARSEAAAMEPDAEPDELGTDGVVVDEPRPVAGALDSSSSSPGWPETEVVERANAEPEVRHGPGSHATTAEEDLDPITLDPITLDPITLDPITLDHIAPVATEASPASVEVDLDLSPAESPSSAGAPEAAGTTAAEEPERQDAEADDARRGAGWLASVANALRPIGAKLGPITVRALEGANFPLRYVPPSVRPIVDWLALSLLFWVPVIWFIALFVVG